MSHFVRDFYPGMGRAVAERTILRKKENGEWETWGDVSNRVALGNSLLCNSKEEQKEEYKILKKHLEKAVIIMSGRHLQHGDETQPERTQEVFTNCATSCSSFAMFYLLMSGSGVGRSYDDDMMLVNWDNAPNLRCVIDDKHPDYDYSAHESVRDARHKYGKGKDILWYEVEDTREGWAKALEVWENAAFEKIHKDKLLILDFSKVRPKGALIKGMQNRPASGPVPLMNSFQKALTLKGAGLPRFMQSMYVDHYFAECVLFGGARRSARMSTKYWKDPTIFQFITIKRPIEYYGQNVEEIIETRKNFVIKPNSFLWSSNNSILVDKEFWELIELKRNNPKYDSSLAKHARKVFKLATTAAYGDGTGEPGFINVDKLNVNYEGTDNFKKEIVGSRKYQINDDTHLYLNRLLKKALKKKYWMIVNPCVTGDTWVLTDGGPKMVQDLIDVPFNAIVDGKPYKSHGFLEIGEKDVFELKIDRGYSITATANHRFLVIRNKKRYWIELQSIKQGDKLLINKSVDKFKSIKYIGKQKVYDCNVAKVNCYCGNGFKSHNCSEIPIALWGAFCVIGDLVPYHADTLDEVEVAARAMTRALIRVNTMDSIYSQEVQRTNRIGIGLTGVHEFAWKFFKLGFRDLIDEEKSAEFWMFLSRIKRAVQDEAEKYSAKYGLLPPHTDVTIKPSGSVSKLFGLTEGWHLAAMKWYLRWVQFSKSDPLVEAYKKNGYPCRELIKYQNAVIIGFPTIPEICNLDIGDKLVTAGECRPEEHYKWLMLGEKYWLRGVTEDGEPLKRDSGGQISFTLKYEPKKISFMEFAKTFRKYQKQIKCCSIMPQEEEASYEYLPEEPVTKAQYEDVLNQIKKAMQEDVDYAHVDCATGACPVSFNK